MWLVSGNQSQLNFMFTSNDRDIEETTTSPLLERDFFLMTSQTMADMSALNVIEREGISESMCCTMKQDFTHFKNNF